MNKWCEDERMHLNISLDIALLALQYSTVKYTIIIRIDLNSNTVHTTQLIF